MKTVTKDMIMADILAIDPALAQILMKSGMHCLGCPSARGETLEQACSVHGADADAMIAEMNAYLASKE